MLCDLHLPESRRTLLKISVEVESEFKSDINLRQVSFLLFLMSLLRSYFLMRYVIRFSVLWVFVNLLSALRLILIISAISLFHQGTYFFGLMPLFLGIASWAAFRIVSRIKDSCLSILSSS